MNRDDFIELLYDKTMKIHSGDVLSEEFPRRLITTILDYAEELGMAPPEMEGLYEDGRIMKRGWTE